MTAIVLILALAGIGAPHGPVVSGAMLDRRTYEIASLLRCPVCQGMSVADSPSTVAVDMKRQVRELVAQGYDEMQIVGYFERSYGQFVLLKPKFRGATAMVWLLPIVALVGGVWLMLRTGSRLTEAKS